MPWNKISLTYEQVEAGRIGKLRTEFRRLLIKNKCPSGMALFLGKPEWDKQQIYPLFLTPTASQLAQNLISLYSGVTCEQPESKNVNWIDGYY